MWYFVGALTIALFILSRIRKQYINPYRLYLIFGAKGGGKTTMLVKQALKYINAGWNVYTNIDDINIPGVRVINADDLGNFVPEEDSLLILDEVGMLYDNRDFKNFRPEVRDFYKLQRHYRVVCFMASQTFDVDKKIRDLCDGMWLCTCVADVFSLCRPIVKKVVLTEATGDGESRVTENLHFVPPWNWKLTYIPKYAKYFDSHAVPEKPLLPYDER